VICASQNILDFRFKVGKHKESFSFAEGLWDSNIPLPAALAKRRTRDSHRTFLPLGGSSGCFWKSGSPGYTVSSSIIADLYSLPRSIDPDARESLLMIVSPKPVLPHSLILRSDVTTLMSILKSNQYELKKEHVPPIMTSISSEKIAISSWRGYSFVACGWCVETF
jgi:hypothetical protein